MKTEQKSAKERDTECDFLCEKRLRDTDPTLHKLYQNSIFATDQLLTGYKHRFPFFTNHTFEHSEQVIRYCNIIAGEELISRLNPDEIYLLLMGASLHDVGMGISEKDFHCFCQDVPGFSSYSEQHHEVWGEYTRAFHQEFGAQFIRKYKAVFEIPSEEHVHCIAQIIRGHRNADLLDQSGYPEAYRLPNGNTVNLAYLTALVKFADELDVTSERNLLFDYSQPYRETDPGWTAKTAMCFRCHAAIKSLRVIGDTVVLFYDTDEPEVEAEILKTRDKVELTFHEYREVVEKRTSFSQHLRRVSLEKFPSCR